jgi:L,D-peptidoglycan transpeptidase YkuD (ErfK/YbiS/YcfS/YnhG family)
LSRRSREPRAGRRLGSAAAVLALLLPATSGAQERPVCPEPLAAATRLVLVTASGMNTPEARLQTFERGTPAERWRAAGRPEPVLIGRAGLAWSHFHRSLARRGEPIKVEGDKRAPAGVYAIGRSFGTLPSSRPGYLHVSAETVCVDDVRSPAYNTITTRDRIAPKTSVENMSRMLPMYRRGIAVDYPSDARAKAGSCIFIHVWRDPKTPTAGCVAMPEARVEALQAFVEPGAAIAIMPAVALDRLPGCLPEPAGARS